MNMMARSPKQLGAALQQRRCDLKLSQAALGDLTGIGQKTISKIENGHDATRADTVFRVLAALDLEILVGPRSKGDDSALVDLLTK